MSSNLTDILEAIEDKSSGTKIDFDEMVEALKYRGFGPLLIGPALIVVLPTGAIPGVPSLCAAMIILISGQLVFGKRFPWIPQRLKDISFERKKYQDAVKKAKPYTEWIDGFFHPRFKILTEDIAQRIIAVICIALSLLMIAFELVPFAAALPALAILLFGLSISIHDGLLTLIGLILMVCAVSIIPFVWSP